MHIYKPNPGVLRLEDEGWVQDHLENTERPYFKGHTKKDYPREDGPDNKNLVSLPCEEWLGELRIFDLDPRILKERVKI